MYTPIFVFLYFALLACCSLCLYRIWRGPTPPDRTVAIDILGILLVGFAAIFSASTGKAYFMNVALAWALLSFIGTLALAKHMEGRNFDD
ncbi:cation:proton antiporter [candidate division FCPU426 bacterium]|nr:cation:proton antiporter [candidate division FCPU426 bacterium]